MARALTAVRCLNFPRYGHAAHRTTANFYLTLLAAASLAALIPIAVVQKTVLMENLLDLFKAPQVIAQFGHVLGALIGLDRQCLVDGLEEAIAVAPGC